MSMKMVSSAISIGVMALLAGCGNQEADPVSSASSNDTGGEQKSYVFGVIAKAQANPVFQAARTGAEAAARKLIAIGDSKPSAKIRPSELAAYTVTASLLLNVNETVTRQ